MKTAEKDARVTLTSQEKETLYYTLNFIQEHIQYDEDRESYLLECKTRDGSQLYLEADELPMLDQVLSKLGGLQ